MAIPTKSNRIFKIELHPEPNVSKTPSPLFLDKRPKTNAIATTTAIINNISIFSHDFYNNYAHLIALKYHKEKVAVFR